MNKSYRHGQIQKVIRTRRIQTQNELAEALAEQGIATTQVTLSRDIREMGLVKTAQGYAQPSDVAPSVGLPIGTALREFLLDVRVAQNLLVLKTPPANASSLAEALDHADWAEITGTIAGDNTVLVIAPNEQTAQALRDRLLGYLDRSPQRTSRISPHIT